MGWFEDATGIDPSKGLLDKKATQFFLSGATPKSDKFKLGETTYDFLGENAGFKEKGVPGWEPDVSTEPQSYAGTPGTGGPRQWRSERPEGSSTPASKTSATSSPTSTPGMSQDTFSGLLSALTGKEEKGPTSFSVQQGSNGGLQYKIDGMEDTPGGSLGGSQKKEEVGTAEDFEKLFGGA